MIYKIGFILIAIIIVALLIRMILRKIIANKIKLKGSNSIQITEKVEIGRIPQWIQIRGDDKDNPVILVLHGGPGSALMGSSYAYQGEWEKYYTIVNWDQRGAGKTYNETKPEDVKPTITMNTMVEDGLEVTKYILEKLNKDKVILLAQSFGSVLGTQMIHKYPEYFTAYIGTGQVVSILNIEKYSYNYTVNLAKEKGDKKTLKMLNDLYPYPDENGYIDFDKWIKFSMIKFKYGYGSIKYPSKGLFIWAMISKVLTSPEYRLKDVVPLTNNNIYRGFIEKELFEFDLKNITCRFKVPFYIIHGEHDLQTPHNLAKEYFEKVVAPKKHYFTLKESAHAVQLDSLEEFTNILTKELLHDLK